MIRGKFRLTEITDVADYKYKKLKFFAVSNDGTPENDRFHKYTPNGVIEMHVDNPSAMEQFKLCQQYYVDFTPA